jgi:peptidoglycan/LPS O-acetylase OafA/YrhL
MPASVRPSPANEVDYASGSLLTIAALLCGGALFIGNGQAAPRGFTWIAGIVALVFFASMIGLWLEPLRRRHGYVRAVAVAGAVMLAAGGVAFTRARPGFTLLSYWLPAILAVGAAILLTRGHHHPGSDPLLLRARRRGAPRP